MQSSTVRQFKSEAGWIDLWGCLLSSIDYRKSFVQHRSSLVHPWHSGWEGRSGFWLQRAFGDVQTWGLTGQAGAQHTTILHCRRVGWLSICWRGQWRPTTHELTAGFHLWERGRCSCPFFPAPTEFPGQQEQRLVRCTEVREQLQGSNSYMPGTEGDGCHLHSLSVAMALDSPGFPARSLSDVSLKLWMLTQKSFTRQHLQSQLSNVTGCWNYRMHKD